ncbi:hypothetical protein [Cupriavidus sp. WS]|uniref:hypothetical protein n=1 Tax=Cupriavidus sp. WS TaxID=1312922 RepID=UPI0012DD78A9|nr:hypothetical protein [Cupriavidus sp. WS]
MERSIAGDEYVLAVEATEVFEDRFVDRFWETRRTDMDRQQPSVPGARPRLKVACRPSVWQPARRARGRVGCSVQATGGAKILGSLTGAVGARAHQRTSGIKVGSAHSADNWWC